MAQENNNIKFTKENNLLYIWWGKDADNFYVIVAHVEIARNQFYWHHEQSIDDMIEILVLTKKYLKENP